MTEVKDVTDYEMGFLDCKEGIDLPTDCNLWTQDDVDYARGWLDAKSEQIADER